MNSKLIQLPLGHLLAILLLGTLAYSNSFGVPFVLDDLASIVNNESIRSLGNFLPGGSGYDFLFRRWVGYFTFAVNYRIGGYDVTGYHLFNLAVHLGTALLVYILVRLTFRTPRLASSCLAPQAGTAAFLAALFFVAHPVQTQAVTYIFQRLASLCTLFYLLSLVLYAWGRLHLEERGQGSRITDHGSRHPKHFLLLAASVLAAILAMFTKEIAFTLPLATMLYEFCFFRGRWQHRAMLLIPLLLTLAIIPATVLSSAELADDGTLRESRFDIPRSHYLLTQFRVIVTYLRLLILPVNQNLDYDYPVYTTFWTPPVFLSCLLLLSLLGLAGWCYRKGGARTLAASPQPPAPELRLVAFGIFWFFLALIVESSFVPLDDVIFEHRLYLPSIGLATALAVGIVFLTKKTAALLGGRLPILAAALAIVVLTAATWQRNLVWQSEVSLWEDVISKSPGKVRPWYNLGTHLSNTGRPAEAIPVLARAVKLDPQHADAWHNLGRAYLLLGRSNDAVPALRTAVRLAPELNNAILNLSSALLQTGKPAEAATLLEKVQHRFPDWPEVRFSLGIAYAGCSNIPAARRELSVLQRLDPNLARSLSERIHRATSLP